MANFEETKVLSSKISITKETESMLKADGL
jgi:hypothetical protein